MSRRIKAQPRAGTNSPPRPRQVVAQTGNESKPAVRLLDRWWPVIICFLLALAVWVVFGQTVHHGFLNFDDDVDVYENLVVSRGLHWDGIVWAFTKSHSANWHPLTSISHMLDCEFYGLRASGHHLTNVLLHATTVIFLFLVLRNMTGALWRSAFVAAVFAIHPLRVESVAWVTERKDVLSGLFFVLTVGAYVRYTRQPFAVGRYLLVLLPLALGLLSKAMLVTTPFVLLLLDYWPLRRVSGVRCQVSVTAIVSSNLTPRSSPISLLLEKIPLLLLAAASCVATVWAARLSLEPVDTLSFLWRVGNAVVSYATYIGQMFYPVGLAVLYPHPGKNLPVWMIGLSAAILSIISVGVVAGWRKRLYLLVGWLWFLGMLVPVIGIMQVGNQARADRFTYLPHIGLYVMVAWGTVDLCGAWRYRRAVLGGAAAVILGGLLVAAYIQTTFWRESVLLWSHALACTSGNFIAHNNLGTALGEEGRLNESISHYEQAIQLKPTDAEAYSNLGNRLAEQDKFDEALRYYERALQLKPNDVKSHYNLGVTLSILGRLEEAIPHYERAIQLKSDYVDAHVNLGNAFIRQGKVSEAIPHYELALELKPDFAQVQYNLGNALAKQGKLDESISHYERALQLKPDYGEGHFNLGHTLAAQGNLSEAIPHFQQALNLATAKTNLALIEAARARLESYQPSRPKYENP